MPHHKDGDHEIAGNNRSISLLPVVSKICERVALEQFSNYLNESRKLSIHQSGNKKNHSTETLQILVLDYISQATAVILLDLSKAFDSICHDTLLKKLETLGTGPSAINWFRSYLTNRYQFVRIGECRSKVKRTTHGVPQGSISGALLFDLYINEISNTCPYCDIKSCADDSKLILSIAIKDLSDGVGKLDADLKNVAA